ncbi:MAG: beta-propeller fold lactonase family protein, partial [Candidatus Woesearchaeota archaeon]
MLKKFILFLFLGIFLVSFVSAVWYNPLTWFSIEDETINTENIKEQIKNSSYIEEIREQDSVETKEDITKTYTSLEKEIKINDSGKTIIQSKLLTPYNYKTGAGEDVLVAEFYLEDYNNLENIFDSINFYDIKKDYEIKEKEYWFKYGTDYIEEECHKLSEFEPDIKEDGTFCQNVTKTNWIRFDNLKELPNKNIKIGLFTDTRGDKKIEWIGNIKGINILEWASYEIVGVSTYTDSVGAYSVDYISSLAFSPDGNYLATSSYYDDYVSIMNITNKSVIAPLSTYTDSVGAYSVDAIYSLAFSPDGNYLATSSYYDDYVSIMNITNKSVIAPLSTFNDNETDYSVDGIRSLAFSPDGNYLATSSYDDDYVSIMNITNKGVIAPISTYTDSSGAYSVDYIYSLAFSPDGNYLATSSYYDDYVSIMNITNKSVIAPLSTYTDSVGAYSVDAIYSLAFSPDGNYLATSSYYDDYVSIMNITNKSVIAPLSTFNDNETDYSVD